MLPSPIPSGAHTHTDPITHTCTLQQVSYADARQRGKAMEATARYLQLALAPVAPQAAAAAAAHSASPLLSPSDERGGGGSRRGGNTDRSRGSRRRRGEEEDKPAAPVPGSAETPLSVLLVPTLEWQAWLAAGGVEPVVREAPEPKATGGGAGGKAAAAEAGQEQQLGAQWEVPVPAARTQAAPANAPSPLPGRSPVADALSGNVDAPPPPPPARPVVVVRETHVVPRNQSQQAQLRAHGLVRQPASEKGRRGGKRAKPLPPPIKKGKGAESDEAVQEALRKARDVVLVDRFLVVPYDPVQEEEMHAFLDGYRPRPTAADAAPAPAPQAGGRRVSHSAQVQSGAGAEGEEENEAAAVKGAPVRAVDVHVGGARQPLAVQKRSQEV